MFFDEKHFTEIWKAYQHQSEAFTWIWSSFYKYFSAIPLATETQRVFAFVPLNFI